APGASNGCAHEAPPHARRSRTARARPGGRLRRDRHHQVERAGDGPGGPQGSTDARGRVRRARVPQADRHAGVTAGMHATCREIVLALVAAQLRTIAESQRMAIALEAVAQASRPEPEKEQTA